MSALVFPLNFPELSKEDGKTDSAVFPSSLCHQDRCVPVLAWVRWARTVLLGRFWSLALFLGVGGFCRGLSVER